MSAVVLVTAVGAASGSRAAAAALACAGSEPDRPGLLIDVGGRPPRPTLVASTGARELEERLAVHLPQLRAASRGQFCHLAVPDDPDRFDGVHAALPLVRDSVAVIHLPPSRLREALASNGIRPTGAMLRADLDKDRALTALAVRDLVSRELRTKVQMRALGWVPARRALFGVLPPGSPGSLPAVLLDSLLESEISAAHACYSDFDDAEIDPARTAQRQRRDHARPRPGRGLPRDSQRQAGR
ncbi:MAG TPA: hypothetical protein VGN84_06320 [Solirubrobacterales bacterium]|jgi:hypothetical protein|nr:hypothetical protein [Solirubrobacterales bacterium]